MTANNSKSYLGYFNKLVDKYNNMYHRSIDKKPIHADYYVLTEEIETNSKVLKLLSIRICLAKITPKIGQKKYLALILR